MTTVTDSRTDCSNTWVKPHREKKNLNTTLGETEQSTHMCKQHLGTIYHLSRGALPIEPMLIWGGGVKGREVSIRLRGHSEEQAQTTGALLCSASTWKEKVMACMDTQTLLLLTPLIPKPSSSGDTNAATPKPLYAVMLNGSDWPAAWPSSDDAGHRHAPVEVLRQLCQHMVGHSSAWYPTSAMRRSVQPSNNMPSQTMTLLPHRSRWMALHPECSLQRLPTVPHLPCVFSALRSKHP